VNDRHNLHFKLHVYNLYSNLNYLYLKLHAYGRINCYRGCIRPQVVHPRVIQYVARKSDVEVITDRDVDHFWTIAGYCYQSVFRILTLTMNVIHFTF